MARIVFALFAPSRWFSYTRRLEWENELLREALAEYQEREQEQRRHERVLYNSLLKQSRAVPVPLGEELPRQKTTNSIVSMRPSYAAIQKEHRQRMQERRHEQVANLSSKERATIKEEAERLHHGDAEAQR